MAQGDAAQILVTSLGFHRFSPAEYPVWNGIHFTTLPLCRADGEQRENRNAGELPGRERIGCVGAVAPASQTKSVEGSSGRVMTTNWRCAAPLSEDLGTLNRLTPLPNCSRIGYTSTMATALLQTKFYRPSIHANLVPRPHLIERLNEGLRNSHSLTLISAPAGYGKTTLVAAWLRQLELSRKRVFGKQCATEPPIRCAWLSLDQEEGEPTRFFTYLLASIHKTGLDLEETERCLLGATQPSTRHCSRNHAAQRNQPDRRRPALDRGA